VAANGASPGAYTPLHHAVRSVSILVRLNRYGIDVAPPPCRQARRWQEDRRLADRVCCFTQSPRGPSRSPW